MIKKYFFNITLLFSSLFVACVVLELILRLFTDISVPRHTRNESDFIEYDKLVGYLYKRNAKFNIKNNDYRIEININSFGYRDKEWNFNNNSRKYLVVGNSISAGFGIDTDKRFSDILQFQIKKEKGDSAVNIYNAAVAGYNIKQMCITIERMLTYIKPEKVILGFNLHALDRLHDPFIYFKGFSVRSSKVPYAKIYNGELYIHQFKNNSLQSVEYFFIKNSLLYNFVIARLNELKNKLSREQESEMILSETFNVLSELNNRLKNNSKLIIVPVIQHDHSKKFSTAIVNKYIKLKLYCHRHHIEMVDILPLFQRKIKKGTNLWINNDAHWNEIAHSIAARAIFVNL